MTRVLSAVVLLSVLIGDRLVSPARVDARDCRNRRAAGVSRVRDDCVGAGRARARASSAARRFSPPAPRLAMPGVPVDVVLHDRDGRCRAVSRSPRASRARRCSATPPRSLFPAVYIGLPLGALAAVRAIGGRDARFWCCWS